MAVELTVQSIKDGGTVTFVVPDLTDNFYENDGDVEIWVNNTGGPNITMTRLAQRFCNQGFKLDQAHTCQGGGITVVSKSPTRKYNDGAGKAHFSMSSNSGVGVAAVHTPRGTLP